MSSEEAIKLYKLYLDTNDTVYIHKIILSYDKIIKKIINKILEKEMISKDKIDEYYSDIYFTLFEKLEKVNPDVAMTTSQIYFYIRRWTIASLTLSIQKERAEQAYYFNNSLMTLNNTDVIEDLLDKISLQEKYSVIRRYIHELSDREQKILYALYKFSDKDERHTLTELAKVLNISKERVRQLREIALKKIYKKIINDTSVSNILMLDKETVKKHMVLLSPAEQRVVDLFYGICSHDIGLSVEEIANIMEIDISYVKYFKKSGMKKIYSMVKKESEKQNKK